jgi:tripartite-type tricarboxylate transporter receptor subunit TctC
MRLAKAMTAALLLAALPNVYAQAPAFPDKPLRMFIGFAAGGSTDIVGRLVAAKLSETLGKPVIVENRGGAAGALASGEVARAAPDGYTLLIHIVTTGVIGPLTQKGLPFDVQKDFQPVAMVAKLPNVMIVNKDIPAKNLREFITWAKANPGKVNYGTGGTGSVQHLSGELLSKMAGIEMTHVPYKGAAPAITDLMAGNIAVVFDNVTGTIGPIKAGTVRALGVSTEERVAVLPDVPTLAEAGLPEFKNSSWIAVFTRSGTPAPIVSRLEAASLAAARHPETVAKLKELGALPAPMPAAELDRFWKSEFDYWRGAIKAANLKLE